MTQDQWSRENQENHTGLDAPRRLETPFTVHCHAKVVSCVTRNLSRVFFRQCVKISI